MAWRMAAIPIRATITASRSKSLCPWGINDQGNKRMTPERWQQIRDVLEEALELAPEQRSAFLQRNCSSDPSLRQEVETLLASSPDVRSSFLQSSPRVVTLTSGTKLGEYEVKSLLGSGGMGEVYRARDSRLGRDVAIKVLPLLATDSDRLRRFEQEARAAAALNHPNILAVFQMGTYEGAPYLVSELLEGETLREQLKRGPLSVRKAIEYGVQIAHGLAAAHEKGIVHRDLKPENLFVTRDGRVKILDFGLAKLTQPRSSSDSATKLTQVTEPGVVMGTVGYMAPEQVRGQTTDHRADIFAFGATLYEMLAGKRAFQKPTSADTMSAILNEDPPGISQATGNIPQALQRVVHRCLEKNPEQRFQSASDLAFALDALSDSQGSAHVATTARANISARERWKIIVPVTLLVLLVGVYFYFHRAPKLSATDTIVLTDFTNSTGDPVFDGTLKQALETILQQSPFLKILSDQKTREELKLMGHPTDGRLDQQTSLELCQRTESKAVLTGSIASLGSQYLLNLNAINCQTGDSLAREEARANKKEEVLDALDTAAAKLRVKLGESLTMVQKFNQPLAEVTTPSLEALKSYSQGLVVQSQEGDAAALPFAKRAIELDPNFVNAYKVLGTLYSNLGESELASKNIRKAYELRDRVSQWEKLQITASYYSHVTGELEKSIEANQVWAQTYPRDNRPHVNVAVLYANLGQPERCISEALAGIQLAPDNGNARGTLANCYAALNRFAEAKATYEQALADKLDNVFLHQVRYAIAFLEGDAVGLESQVTWASGKAVVEPIFLSDQALSFAFSGQLAKAREMFSRADETAALSEDQKETAGTYQATAASVEADFGNPVPARANARAALTLSSGQTVVTGAAAALSSAGDSSRALQLADELAKRYPLDTLLNGYWLPAIRARVEINLRNPIRAIGLLQTSTPYERSDNSMFAVYVCGEAYLAAGQGSAAAAEFQKILDHSGLVQNYWVGALARLGVARGNALESRTSQGAEADAARGRARAAYKDFLMLWKDADSDIPILKEAKKEYAELQ